MYTIMSALREIRVTHPSTTAETSPTVNHQQQNNSSNILMYAPLTPISPEEELIRLRGRRKPVANTIEETQLTPKKSPIKSPRKSKTPQKLTPPKTPLVPSRSSPRKRLNLQDFSSYSETPITLTPRKKRFRANAVRKIENLNGALSTLSQKQLINLVQSLMINRPELRNAIINGIPLPDLNPLEDKLSTLQRNIHRSIPSTRWESNRDMFCYRRVSSHLESFKKECIEQGHHLIFNEQWESALDYVLIAWRYVRGLPDWENEVHNKTKIRCFKALGVICFTALKKMQLEKHEFVDVLDRLTPLLEDNNSLGESIKYLQQFV